MIPYEILKRDYEQVRSDHPGAGLKPYDDLTDDERSQHEAIYRQTAGFFRELGIAISNGTELPNPFDRK